MYVCMYRKFAVLLISICILVKHTHTHTHTHTHIYLYRTFAVFLLILHQSTQL
jgi:hypothetical protein